MVINCKRACKRKRTTMLTVEQMVDIALGTPEIGAVNFNVLHALIHVIIQRLNIQKCLVEFKGYDSDRMEGIILTAKPGPILKLSEYMVDGTDGKTCGKEKCTKEGEEGKEEGKEGKEGKEGADGKEGKEGADGKDGTCVKKAICECTGKRKKGTDDEKSDKERGEKGSDVDEKKIGERKEFKIVSGQEDCEDESEPQPKKVREVKKPCPCRVVKDQDGMAADLTLKTVPSAYYDSDNEAPCQTIVRVEPVAERCDSWRSRPALAHESMIKLEEKVAMLQDAFEALEQLPTNEELKKRAQTPGAHTPVKDLWQLYNLNKRVEGCEGTIEKLASMIEDLVKETCNFREAMIMVAGAVDDIQCGENTALNCGAILQGAPHGQPTISLGKQKGTKYHDSQGILFKDCDGKPCEEVQEAPTTKSEKSDRSDRSERPRTAKIASVVSERDGPRTHALPSVGSTSAFPQHQGAMREQSVAPQPQEQTGVPGSGAPSVGSGPSSAGSGGGGGAGGGGGTNANVTSGGAPTGPSVSLGGVTTISAGGGGGGGASRPSTARQSVTQRSASRPSMSPRANSMARHSTVASEGRRLEIQEGTRSDFAFKSTASIVQEKVNFANQPDAPRESVVTSISRAHEPSAPDLTARPSTIALEGKTFTATGEAPTIGPEFFKMSVNEKFCVLKELVDCLTHQVKKMSDTFPVKQISTKLCALVSVQKQVDGLEKEWRDFLSHYEDGGINGFIQEFAAVKQNVDNLTTALNKLKQDKVENENALKLIAQETNYLKKVKADFEVVEDLLAEKADTTLVNRKVSHDQFDAACDDLTRGLDEALDKLLQQEHMWNEAMDEIQNSLDNKLDKVEIMPLKEFISKKLTCLQEKLRQLAQLRKVAEAAGAKSRILRNMNCIACDGDVIMKMDNKTTYPSPAVPPSKTLRPMLVYELEQVRKAMKKGAPCRATNHVEEALMDAQKKEIGIPLTKDDAIRNKTSRFAHYCNRYCGGSHTITTPQQRVTRIGHFLTEFGPQAIAMFNQEFEEKNQTPEVGIPGDLRKPC